MNKYSSLTFIANIEIIDDINNEMEEKEERKIDLVNEESDILNAKIVSLTSQLDCLRKQLTEGMERKDIIISELRNELNVFKEEQNNIRSYVFEETKVNDNKNITNITSELLTQRIKLEKL
eukprot:111791_1